MCEYTLVCARVIGNEKNIMGFMGKVLIIVVLCIYLWG